MFRYLQLQRLGRARSHPVDEGREHHGDSSDGPTFSILVRSQVTMQVTVLFNGLRTWQPIGLNVGYIGYVLIFNSTSSDFFSYYFFFTAHLLMFFVLFCFLLLFFIFTALLVKFFVICHRSIPSYLPHTTNLFVEV
jgi:hypothetical protein